MPEGIIPASGPVTAADLKLVDRAIKGGWGIPSAIMDALPIHLAEQALNVGADGVANTGHIAREDQHRAAAMLIRMVGQNQINGPLRVEHTGPGGGPIQQQVVVDVEALTVEQAELLQHSLEAQLGVLNPIAIGHAVVTEDVEPGADK